MNAIRLYFRLVRVSLRTQMAYRASFSVQMLANIATTLADFFAVFAFFQRFGALGHAITDSDTQQVLTVGRGQIMQADVVDVRKGEAGFPGELKGSFLRENRVLGDIFVNNQYGIYGELEEIPEHPLYPDGVPIGRRDAVHTGPATILSTVGTDGMREYDVEIVEVARQSQPAQRSMVLRVTDPELLERTGGIVQGMSGSPILQDGRLIGAVTHVWVNP